MRDAIRKELELYLDRFHRALERLDDATVWQRPAEGVNSVANLVLHIEGNIRLFVGQGVGGLEYERDRNAEFEARDGKSIAELRAIVRQTRELVGNVLGDASDETLAQPSEFEDFATKRELVLHVMAHAGFHAGQALLMAKLLSKDTTRLLDWGH